MNTIKKTMLGLGLAGCLALPVLAADKITLNDGREFIGEITSQTENVIQIKVTHGEYVKTMTFWMGEVADISEGVEVESDGPKTGSTESTGSSSRNVAASTTAPHQSSNNPGVLVLPLTGTVGIEFRCEEIDAIGVRADEIKKETGKAPIIILEIESGGGLVIETYMIHDSLVELKRRHRVIAWVKEAISAACATALHCDEIYFMTGGNAGAMTAFAGAQSLQGEAREEWIRTAGEYAEAGGRSPFMAQAMVGNEFLLSYDKDEETGEVTWYDDLSGEFVLSREHQNLSFTKSTALHSGFADGLADTGEELAKLLDLPEWYEVDSYGRDMAADWVALCKRAKEDIPRTFGKLQIAQNSAAADNLEKIGRQIKLVERLIWWWKQCPNVCMYEVGVPPKEDLQRIIEQLRRLAGQIRRGGGGG